MEEIYTLVNRELLLAGLDEYLTAGVVLTGGSVLLEGAAELGEQVFGLPVRIGYPAGVGGLVDVVNSPAYATGVGLVLYGARQGGLRSSVNGFHQGVICKVKARMTGWLSEYF